MKNTIKQPKTLRRPDYKKIYTDLITLKYPHLLESCNHLLQKDSLLPYDVLKLSRIICGNDDEALFFNSRHKSYDIDTIMKILYYQKKNRCSNIKLAAHFKLSRNTVTKWKKFFLV